MNSRTYEGLHDLHAMLDLLSAGRAADNGTYYVHRGDLQWWLFYNDDPTQEWKNRIRLWVDGERLLGWSLLSPFAWHAFDVYDHPSLRGTEAEREMLTWAVNQLSDDEYIQTVWVAEDDNFRVHWLTENGFTQQEGLMHLLSRSLSDFVAGAPIPSGFHARTSRGPEDASRNRLAWRVRVVHAHRKIHRADVALHAIACLRKGA